MKSMTKKWGIVVQVEVSAGSRKSFIKKVDFEDGLENSELKHSSKKEEAKNSNSEDRKMSV